MNISFCEAISKFIIDPLEGDEGKALDITTLTMDFLSMLEVGRLSACGYSMQTSRYEDIPKDFWKWLRTQFLSHRSNVDFKWTGGDETSSVWKYVNGERVSIYEGIEVSDEKRTDGKPTATGRQSKGGRPPNTEWQIITAIACGAIHELGYDESQINIVRYIEDKLDGHELSKPPGRENIVKLVRTIFQHRPA